MNYSRFFLGCKEKFFRKIVKKVDKWVCLLYNISEFCGGRPAEEGYICRTNPGIKRKIIMKKQKISDAVIHRLPRYYRYLDDLYNKGVVRISSSSLGSKMDITASQIRQDLSCFGEFGQQGYGYNVARAAGRDRSHPGH